MQRVILPLAAGLVLLTACPSRDIVPLVGEDPEIAQLLETRPLEDPSSSALEAARRLHQALVQQDSDLIWALLATPTRRALDERGSSHGISGRELIDGSTLASDDGTIRKVRYEVLFFGPELERLTEPAAPAAEPTTRVLVAVSKTGKLTELRFLREEDGWKLAQTTF